MRLVVLTENTSGAIECGKHKEVVKIDMVELIFFWREPGNECHCAAIAILTYCHIPNNPIPYKHHIIYIEVR